MVKWPIRLVGCSACKRRIAAMGLYQIMEAFLLMANGVAILNEDRFLAPYGLGMADTGSGRVSPFKVGQPEFSGFSQSGVLSFPSTSFSSKGLGVRKLEILRVRRTSLSRSGARRPISAVAVPLAPPSNPLEDAGERQRLVEEYGFTQIGEPVPAEVTLKKVIDSFPPESSRSMT